MLRRRLSTLAKISVHVAQQCAQTSPAVRIVYASQHGELHKTTAMLSDLAIGCVSRQASVLNGLAALAASSPDLVLIHDGARPFVSATTISKVMRALLDRPAVLAALPVTDTLKRTSDDDLVAETVPRAGLWRAQTPQGFHFAQILAAHRNAATEDLDSFTDDAAIAGGMPRAARSARTTSATVSG